MYFTDKPVKQFWWNFWSKKLIVQYILRINLSAPRHFSWVSETIQTTQRFLKQQSQSAHKNAI